MLADTTFTMKSGPLGTSMFSRSGKVTNYQYVCFSNGHPEPEVIEETEEQKMLQEMAPQQTKLDYMGDTKRRTTSLKKTKNDFKVDKEDEKRVTYFEPQPGVNTSSFLAVTRDSKFKSIVNVRKYKV